MSESTIHPLGFTPLQTVTLRELMAKTFPEPRWAVPGLIPQGLTILSGSPKTGKSWTCLDLAIAVATGGKVMGKIPVEQGKVLYAALEDPEQRLQGRSDLLLGDAEIPDGLHLVTSLPRLPLLRAVLDHWLTDNPDTRLVALDVLTLIRPESAGSRMSYSEDYAVMGVLKELADAHGVAVLVVHHLRKSLDESDVFNTVSGTTGITGAADALLVLARTRNTDIATLHVTGRDIEERELTLVREPDSVCWTIEEEQPVVATMGETRRQILDRVRDHPGETPTQISAGTGLSLSTVKQTVRRMARAGQLRSDGQGRYESALSPVSPLSLVTSDPQGDSSDGGDTSLTEALEPVGCPDCGHPSSHEVTCLTGLPF